MQFLKSLGLNIFMHIKNNRIGINVTDRELLVEAINKNVDNVIITTIRE